MLSSGGVRRCVRCEDVGSISRHILFLLFYQLSITLYKTSTTVENAPNSRGSNRVDLKTATRQPSKILPKTAASRKWRQNFIADLFYPIGTTKE